MSAGGGSDGIVPLPPGPAGEPDATGDGGGQAREAEVLPLHPDECDVAPFDDMPDLTDRRRLLLQLIFGVHVEDPDPVFDPEDES